MKLRVTMAPGRTCDNKVTCIKAWRTVTGLGLKEAKDAVEAVMEGKPTILETSLAPDHPELRNALAVIQGENMVVSTQNTTKATVLRAVESAAKLSLDNGEYDLAIDLTEILKKHVQGIK